VIEVNSALMDDPSALNDDPNNEGWLVRIEMDSEKELANLMRSPDYKKLISEK
jgi:glycine cleavage system H protein